MGSAGLFLRVKTSNELSVDTSRGEELQINVCEAPPFMTNFGWPLKVERTWMYGLESLCMSVRISAQDSLGRNEIIRQHSIDEEISCKVLPGPWIST